MVESRLGVEQPEWIPLGMAGHALSLRTDSKRLATIASEFFPPVGSRTAHPPRAAITMFVRERGESHQARRMFPIFRGRKEYMHADYGRDGSVWFDLKTREVLGVISDELIADANVFRRTVLTVVAGALAPALGMIGLHAGCVVRNGKAALLAAASGTGKSTLTLALALRGWRLLSDDWTFIAETPNGLRAWGMMTEIKLMPDAVRFFPKLAALCPGTALNGEISFEVDPWSFFQVNRAIEARPISLVFLDRGWEESYSPRCCITRNGIETTRAAILKEIEEQPTEVSGPDGCKLSLIEKLCALPSFNLRVNGHPAAIAAELDSILTEQICA